MPTLPSLGLIVARQLPHITLFFSLIHNKVEIKEAKIMKWEQSRKIPVLGSHQDLQLCHS